VATASSLMRAMPVRGCRLDSIPTAGCAVTLRYMHLAPSALREAIGLLDDLGQPVGSAESAAV
jgi:hypothetical protein